MVNIDFVNADLMSQCRASNEIMSMAPFVRQLYDDICATIGCFKPDLIINQFGNMEYMPEINGRYCQSGIYYTPGLIIISLIDLYVMSWDNSHNLNISIDDAFKAEAAHTILHELSHSMQNASCIPPEFGAAFEWVNEKNTWEKLYPIVDPMLRKKYKIKLYEQTIDKSVGRVFSYPYSASDDYMAVITYIISFVWDGDISIYNSMLRDFNNAIDLTLNLSILDKNYDGLEIKKNGVINYDVCRRIRSICSYNINVWTYSYSLTDMRNDFKHLVINLSMKRAESEIIYNTKSEEFNFHPEYYAT